MNNRKKRISIDWIVLGIVVLIAMVVITLSFSNTAKLAGTLGLNPYLTAGLVEILFGALLFIRGKQRATQRNVPVFLTVGYFASLIFVTGVNMWGLAQEHVVIGSIVGLLISGAMWLMETVLVWLWVDSDKPYEKSIRDRMKEARRDIKEEKACQRIDWMRFEAQKPDLKLIMEARKEEQRRKEILEDGLPEFFKHYQPEIVMVPELIKEKQPAQVVPMKPIGFHMHREENQAQKQPGDNPGEVLKHQGKSDIRQGQKTGQKSTADPAEMYIQQALQIAKKMLAQGKDIGRNTLAKEAGVTPHYSKKALQRLKNEQAN